MTVACGATIAFGVRHVAAALETAGWRGFALLALWQLVLVALLGLAWAAVCPGASPLSTIWGRLVREGATNCLPFSEVGGLVVGARALVLRGIGWERAAVSSSADIAAEAMAEVPFVGFGIAMLAARQPGSSLLLPALAGLALAVAIGIALLTLTRRVDLLRRLGHRVARSWFPADEGRVDLLGDEAALVFGRTGRLALATGLHLVGWFGGGVSVFIAYRAVGAPAGLIQSMAVEALLSGALGIAFLVPAGLGVQELSYVGVGALFGLPPQASLALSFLRRGRDLVLGAPALGWWQLAEARRLRAGVRLPSGPTGPDGTATPSPGAPLVRAYRQTPPSPSLPAAGQEMP